MTIYIKEDFLEERRLYFFTNYFIYDVENKRLSAEKDWKCNKSLKQP